MLGSVVDADDAVQETMIRTRRNLDRFNDRAQLKPGCTGLRPTFASLETEKPKLLFWEKPGGLISQDKAAWYQARLKNCQLIGAGEGIHYLQEHNPEAIGKGITKWLTNI
jgi:Sigma-70 region 2